MNHKLDFVKRYKLLNAIIIAIAIGGMLFAFYLNTVELTEYILLQQARAFFAEIVLTRQWVAGNGGVYVPVKPGTEPNPTLSSLPGLKVNINDEDGMRYTLRNPALVTREISALADKHGLFKFHITSLKSVGQDAKPDTFETEALKSFEKGGKEYYAFENMGDGSYFRYMAPLHYEASCDNCHSSLGYRPGDIRGGISVSIPTSLVRQRVSVIRSNMILGGLAVIGLLIASLYMLSRKFTRLLNEAHGELAMIASTDSLTGLDNRRVGIEKLEEEISRHHRSELPLSCLLLDIDRFKSVNDSYGHQAGDAVLVMFADTLRQSLRKHDVICRYGGEEFMVLLPETGLEPAVAVAEKIRLAIAGREVSFNGRIIKVTVSIGATQLAETKDDTVDAIIARADDALYKAKAEGRNRVEVVEKVCSIPEK